MDYKEIKTSQEMNETVKNSLAVSRIKIQLYALKRIEELEEQNKKLKSVLHDLKIDMEGENLSFPDYAKKVINITDQAFDKDETL